MDHWLIWLIWLLVSAGLIWAGYWAVTRTLRAHRRDRRDDRRDRRDDLRQ